MPPFPQDTFPPSPAIQHQDDLKQRTNQQWIAALNGSLGSNAQGSALTELANYQYIVIMRYLAQNRFRVLWLAEMSRDELSPLAEDIVQSSLERLTRTDSALLSQFEGRGSFMGWAAQIALNAARSELRRVHWHRCHPLNDIQFQADHTSVEPTHVVAQQELILTINQCLAELSDTYREVVERCLINGECAPDVARDLKRSVQAVYNILNRAKRQLVRLLEERHVRLEDLGGVVR